VLGEEAYAASTAPPFEKGGRKLFIKLTKVGSFVYSLICPSFEGQMQFHFY